VRLIDRGDGWFGRRKTASGRLQRSHALHDNEPADFPSASQPRGPSEVTQAVSLLGLGPRPHLLRFRQLDASSGDFLNRGCML
jgi:hypothetical protein